ncbi:retrovirus-related pol polyprotein from transposon TNT 1-94 [Tanacetum coccineum]
MTESPLMDSGFAVPIFSPGDDPIACLNKAMTFLIVVASSRFPSTNHQLRTSSNLRNQATIQDDRVLVQKFQGRQGQSYSGTGYKGNATSYGGNNASGQARDVKCYNRQDPGVPDGQAVQTIIPNNATFQTEDLDTYDSDCDDISNAKAVLMANISNYGSDIILEIMRYTVIAISFRTLNICQKHNSESKEKEDKYMENEIDLEKKIKELDNILFKVGQSGQTLHMLTKPQAFYDNIHKQALGYQNPFLLKKAQRIKPTLYDGIVMSAKHVAIILILEEESRSKILSDDFGKRFTPQQELSAKQAFWLRMSNPTNKPCDASPVKIKAPKELPKVSLVNESLKKLKFHLVRFDNVVKIRTTPDARTEGEWGFEHTKVVFNNEIIPFLKSLKDIFNVFDRDILNEIMEVQTVAAVQQSSVDKQCLEIAKKELLLENDRLLQQIMSQDVLLTVMNSMSLIDKSVNVERKRNETCDKCFNLEAELLKSQNAFNVILKKNEDLKAQIQDKVFVITSLKNDLRKIKGKEIVDIAAQIPSANTIVPGMFKLDLEPLAPSAKKVAVTPKNKIKKVRFAEPLTSSSNIKQVESSNTSDSNTPVLSSTGLKCSTSKCGSKPTGNKRNDRISQTPSRNMKNKVEAQPRKVNNKNRAVEPICDVNVKHSLLNANSEPICATCKKSMFDGVHDICLLDFVENMNSHVKSAKKHKKQNIWKPTGHVFTKVGLNWNLTCRTFTIVGNSCPLTRITLANIVPPKKTTSHSVETQKPELKVYSRKPKNVKNVGCRYYSLVSGLWMFKTHDREPLLAHELSSKTKSWLWHRRLSHLNFGTLNKLAKDGLARGIPRLKFQKDHLCSACALGKSKKSSHQPKAEDTNQEKLYLLHMDLCGLMRVASINGKRYILVIVDDYSRFTWVRFLRTKDEAPEAIIKCIKNIQVRLNATVCNVRTDNGTEFVNQTLREFYENVGISHQTSVARTPQQNGVVER